MGREDAGPRCNACRRRTVTMVEARSPLRATRPSGDGTRRHHRRFMVLMCASSLSTRVPVPLWFWFYLNHRGPEAQRGRAATEPSFEGRPRITRITRIKIILSNPFYPCPSVTSVVKNLRKNVRFGRIAVQRKESTGTCAKPMEASHEVESGGGAQSSARNFRQRRGDSPPPPEVHGPSACAKRKEAFHELGRDAFHRVRNLRRKKSDAVERVPTVHERKDRAI